jgi:hypothetical protein
MFGIALLLAGIIWGLYFGIPALQYLGESQSLSRHHGGAEQQDAAMYMRQAESYGLKAMLGLIIVAVGIFVIADSCRKEKAGANSRQDNTKTHRQSVGKESGDGIDNQLQSLDENSGSGDEENIDFCYHCGEELSEKSTKCPKCGKEL